MELSTIISLASLFIAILALPASYFVAVRQVKLGLDEYEVRNRKRARNLVADAIDEFFKVFYNSVERFTGIEPQQLQSKLKEIDPKLREISTFIESTKVLDRLALSIDNISTIGFDKVKLSASMVDKLISIRNQILMGSNDTRFSFLGVISAIGGIDLQSELRDIK